MQVAKTVLAAAVFVAFSAPALADPVFGLTNISNTTDINNTVYVGGTVAVNGQIGVSAEAGAVSDNTQASVDNLVITIGGGNDSNVRNTGNGASGNVGLNLATGTGNAQSNNAALASLQDASNVFASAQSFSSQISATSANVSVASVNTADLANAFLGVTGNVGVNLAGGAGNMQANQLAAAVHSHGGQGSLVKATGSNEQLVGQILDVGIGVSVANSASIRDALTGSGNIGANVVAGYGNLQHNSLSIASAK